MAKRRDAEESRGGNAREIKCEKTCQVKAVRDKSFRENLPTWRKRFVAGDNTKEFAALVDLGRFLMVGLVTATLHSATLIELQDELGLIELGKLVDINAVDGCQL